MLVVITFLLGRFDVLQKYGFIDFFTLLYTCWISGTSFWSLYLFLLGNDQVRVSYSDWRGRVAEENSLEHMFEEKNKICFGLSVFINR